MNRISTTILLAVFLLALPSSVAMAAARSFEIYDWTLTVDDRTGKIGLERAGAPVVENSTAQWCVGGDTLSLADCKGLSIKVVDSRTLLGKCKTVTLAGRHGSATATQAINFYPDREYVTTELTLSSPQGISSRYLAPIAVTTPYQAFDRSGNYAVFVPYDNDAWVRYRSTAFGEQIPESYEVTALVNADTRRAIVVGSVEHETWKTGIKVATDGACGIDTLIAYGGIATNLTRDIIPHGIVSGKSVKSPLIFIGDYSDWRDGMEAFADACCEIAPKIASRGGRPFGWNSWGKLQTNINYDKAVQVADFIHDALQGESFSNDGTVYIGLDAFWTSASSPSSTSSLPSIAASRGRRPAFTIAHSPTGAKIQMRR